MKKRLTFWRSTIFFSLIVLALLASQTVLFLSGEDSSRSPGRSGEYPDSGYYEINSETILASLDQRKTEVFVPFSGDPDRDEPHYDSISWTQADYLKIANALSLEEWNEPLDLKSWKTEYIRLVQKCENDPHGFHTFAIVYSKELGMRNLERRYVTRLIEINAWQGLIRWGKDATFSSPLLLGWDGAELNQLKITADDALQIAEKNGGADTRLKVNNNCRIILSVNQLSTLPHSQNWLVDYDRANFYMHVNPYSGKYKILH